MAGISDVADHQPRPAGRRGHRSLGQEEAKEGPMTVWIYVNTSGDIGDVEHLKVFATELAANRWFEDNDPEGVAFKYLVGE